MHKHLFQKQCFVINALEVHILHLIETFECQPNKKHRNKLDGMNMNALLGVSKAKNKRKMQPAIPDETITETVRDFRFWQSQHSFFAGLRAWAAKSSLICCCFKCTAQKVAAFGDKKQQRLYVVGNDKFLT